MRFLRRHQYLIAFLGMLFFCSVMVLRQMHANQVRHEEVREAFILLYSKGYTNQANKLFQYLLRGAPNMSTQILYDDFQRTMMLVDPTSNRPDNLIWKYHWAISREMEKRSERNLLRALELASEN